MDAIQKEVEILVKEVVSLIHEVIEIDKQIDKIETEIVHTENPVKRAPLEKQLEEIKKTKQIKKAKIHEDTVKINDKQKIL